MLERLTKQKKKFIKIHENLFYQKTIHVNHLKIIITFRVFSVFLRELFIL